jgi:rubrerythrin
MAKHIEGMECEVDEKITGHPNRFTRYQNRKCSKCGWFGHEGQMGRRRTMFGDGYYPAQCPSCNAVNEAFGLAVIAIEPGYTAVPVIKKEQSQ